jgi:hypothetical protein
MRTDSTAPDDRSHIPDSEQDQYVDDVGSAPGRAGTGPAERDGEVAVGTASVSSANVSSAEVEAAREESQNDTTRTAIGDTDEVPHDSAADDTVAGPPGHIGTGGLSDSEVAGMEAEAAREEPVGQADNAGLEAITTTTLWPQGALDTLRERWKDLQLQFVDDPQTVTAEARALVDDTVKSLTAALHDRKRQLDDWSAQSSSDTEGLRQAIRKYRDFFDELLSR